MWVMVGGGFGGGLGRGVVAEHLFEVSRSDERWILFPTPGEGEGWMLSETPYIAPTI